MEQSTARQPHRLVLENRKKSMISGVQDVQSFHEQEILLLTEEGQAHRSKAKDFMLND